MHIVDDSDVAGMTADQLAQQRSENNLTHEENTSMKQARTTAVVASIVSQIDCVLLLVL